ncbi:MAG: histidine phosphatase family protein [Sandaracinaceae bacterium]
MRRSYYFLRHARAVYQDRGFNKTDYPRGTDWPLAPHGQIQAHRAASQVLVHGVERVVTSCLARAIATAQPIVERGALPYEHRWPELNEIHPRTLRRAAHDRRWPFLEGYRAARALEHHVAGRARDGVYDPGPVIDRVAEVLRRLDRLDSSRIVVVSHGYFILLTALAVGGAVRYRWIDNCSLTRIDADGHGRYRLVSFARPTLVA